MLVKKNISQNLLQTNIDIKLNLELYSKCFKNLTRLTLKYKHKSKKCYFKKIKLKLEPTDGYLNDKRHVKGEQDDDVQDEIDINQVDHYV